jgi:hypothetical protein
VDPAPVLLAAAMSDVEHAGWAVGGPGSQLRRRHSPLLGAVALLLLAGGAVAAALGIVRLATEAGPAEERILARGTVAPLEGPPGAPVPIDSPVSESATLWLNLGGLSNVRETIVAGTECELVRPDGSRERIRGSRQGTAVATDHYETIGAATLGGGRNAVSCRHVPFGRVTRRGRLREEHAFVVERGSPGDGLGGLWLLFGGTAAILLGVAAGVRWRAGRLVPA